jgi:signal transduction histidine kinase
MDAVGRLASGIAHDFGNVLTIISGYSALILATLKPDDPIRPEVEGIQRSAQRATSMIRHRQGSGASRGDDEQSPDEARLH